MKKHRKLPVRRVCAGCHKSFGFIGRHHTMGACKGKGWNVTASAALDKTILPSKVITGAARQFRMETLKKEVGRVSKDDKLRISGSSLKEKRRIVKSIKHQINANRHQTFADQIRQRMDSPEYDGVKFCPYCGTVIEMCFDKSGSRRVLWNYCACCGRGLVRVRTALSGKL